jgi:hypothetical protein
MRPIEPELSHVKFRRNPMYDFESVDQEEMEDMIESQPLVLDGTVNLDYSDCEQDPRIKGLIELVGEYAGWK